MLGQPTIRALDRSALAVALLLAVASALPWEEKVTIAGPHSVSGLHLGGSVTLPLALFAAATSVAAAITGRARFAVPAVLAGAAATVVAARDFACLAQTQFDGIDHASEPELGVLLTAGLGALLAGVAAVRVLAAMRS